MLNVIFYFCCAGLFLTVSLIGPIFIALLSGDMASAQRLALYLLLGGFVFAGPVLAIMGRQRRVPQIGGLYLIALTWLVLPVVAAIPIIDLSELGIIDSLFESVSGLTTAGSSVFNTVEPLSQALLFWRIQLQWIGGFLALLTIFAIIAPMGIGGLSLDAASESGSGGSMAGDARLFSLVIGFGTFYLVISALAFLLFFFSGVRAFHAATLAMTAVSTGGF